MKFLYIFKHNCKKLFLRIEIILLMLKAANKDTYITKIYLKNKRLICAALNNLDSPSILLVILLIGFQAFLETICDCFVFLITTTSEILADKRAPV